MVEFSTERRKPMRLALAQINSVVGDLDGNAARDRRAARGGPRGGRRPRPLPRARRHRLPARGPAAPPRLRPRGAARGRARSRAATHGITALVGAPHLDADLYNACFVLADGEIRVRLPQALPARTTASSTRTATSRPATTWCCCASATCVVGPTICEDIWQPGPPATDLALAGAQLVANISASPFHVGKDREREEMLRVRARDNSCFVALCNAVGGQDELIFDGHSVVLDDEGEVLARAAGLRGGAARRRRRPRGGGRAAAARRAPARARPRAHRRAGPTRDRAARRRGSSAVRCARALAAQLDDLEQMRLALELGLRDYVDEERLRRRRDRPLGRDRLGADGRARRRGARRRARARRLDAVALLVRGAPAATRSGSPSRSGSTSARSRSSRWSRRSRRRSRRALRGPRARPDRGEPAGADPRHAADGALEQVRLARDRDREQVGAVGRLLDALRRPRRRASR